MKPLSTIDQLGEWNKAYTCVWCGTIWQIWASDIKWRVREETIYSALGDYDIVKHDVFFVDCSCGKELELPERDLIFSMREAIKTRGLFPKPEVPATHLTTKPLPAAETDWERLVEGTYKILTYHPYAKELRAIRALDYLNGELGRETPPFPKLPKPILEEVKLTEAQLKQLAWPTWPWGTRPKKGLIGRALDKMLGRD